MTEMEQQEVWVGTLIVGNGISQDNRREVRSQTHAGSPRRCTGPSMGGS